MRTSTRFFATVLAAAISLAAASVASADGGATVTRTPCVLGADLGGAVGLPGTTLVECQFVVTPSGHFTSSFHGQVPAGVTVGETVTQSVTIGTTNCRITLTKSGNINGTCHRPG